MAIKPKCIDDLTIITTLARPASKEIRSEFIDTKNGKKEVSYLHPTLENAFKNTFGYPLYDESLLQLASDVAGWNLAEADKLRKLTKEKGKNPKKAKKWKEEFIEGAVNKGLTAEVAENIWVKVVEPFGKYSFNKSHALLYSIISYETAYLKAHFPVEFLLANLLFETDSNSPDAKDNITKIKSELKSHGIKILPPDINKSDFHYKLIDANTILTGIDALKGVGDEAIAAVMEARKSGSFKNVSDLMYRCNSAKLKANNVQALAATGALDSFGLNRKQIFQYCSDVRKKLTSFSKKNNPEDFVYNFPTEQEWSKPELYSLEFKYLNESYINKKYCYNLFKKPSVAIKTFINAKNKTKVSDIIGIIKDVFEFSIKKEGSKFFGQKMAKIQIEDINNDVITVTVFPDRLEDLYKLR